MSYIDPVDTQTPPDAVAGTLAAIFEKVGMIPNLYATLAKAPSALNAQLSIDQANATGRLSAREREIVSLAASQFNACDYCLSAHSLLAKRAGLSPEQILAARQARTLSSRDGAIALLASSLLESRGHLAPDVLDGFKDAGLSESDLLEVVANVAGMILSNFANNISGTEIDFPKVDPLP